MDAPTFTVTVDYTDNPRSFKVAGFAETKQALLDLKAEYDANGDPARIWAIADKAYLSSVYCRATGDLIAERVFETQDEQEAWLDAWHVGPDGDRIGPDGKPNKQDGVWRFRMKCEIVQAPKLPRPRRKKTARPQYVSPLTAIFGGRHIQ